MEIVYDESTGTWSEREEPYTTLDVQTEEDWNKLEFMINNFSRLEEENKELKRLLRLSVRDIERFRTLMSHCVHKDFCAAALEYNCNPYDLCNSCPLSGSEKCRWQHAEEALKLIGDEDNV